MKRKKRIAFLTVMLFFGLLLTLMLYIGIGTVFERDGRGNGQGSQNGFNATFFEDSAINGAVRFWDYKIFGHVDDSELIVGRDDWIFEAIDSENGYNRLLDYIGGCPFTADELETVEQSISARASECEAAGAKYILAVIPDSMAVCADKVPRYLGSRSGEARLAMLTAYLSGEGKRTCLLDPTSAMIEESEKIPMYNNTENSINAYGAYCIYNSVISRYLADTGNEVEDRIYREDVDFYTRVTDGKASAINAGVAKTVKNRTVSLSDEMTDSYRVVLNERGVIVTERTDTERTSRCDTVVIEYTDDWDRIQLMPYFSNTFDRVYYKNTSASEDGSEVPADVTLVVRLVHESELSTLAER